MNKEFAATEQAQSLSDAITRDAAQLLQMYGTGAVQLPIKGTDQYVIAGTLDAIARAVPDGAHLASQSQAAQPSEHTDLAQRLRAIGEAGQLVDHKTLIQAADEIDRYYTGMLAWKQTAEKKDRDWNAERMGRVNDRIAGQSQATRAVPEGWNVEKSDDTFLGTAIRVSNRREGFATLRPESDDPRETVLFRYFDQLAATGSTSSTPAAQKVTQQAAPTAWLATDLDGRGDVAFTKEEAKRRAGEGCTEFFPLYDIADVTQQAAKAETAEQATALRENLYWAAINCAHSITDDAITLRRNPAIKGNALSQLGDRLSKACSDLAPTTSTVSAPEEVREGCEHCLHTYCLLGEKCRHCGHEAEGQGYKGGKRTTSGKGEAA
jgi:hypothetical protein